MNIIETNLSFKSLGYGNNPKMIVLHHAEASKCSVEDIHSWHKNDNKWAGIAYHYFVRKDGSIYRGRPDNAIGAHAQGHNTNTLGICAEGSYNKETMPQEQKQAIIELCKYLKNKYSINSIKGHRELMATSCPGFNYPLEEIRNTILNGSNNNVGNTGIVNAKSGLNIRSGAGINYSILGAVPNGYTVSLLSKEGNWWKVSYNGITGYVSGDYIETNYNSSSTATTEGYVVTGYLDKQIKGYDGAEVAGAIRYYFKDVDRVYTRSNSIGMWLETQLLPMDKCKELKERLGSFFDSIR